MNRNSGTPPALNELLQLVRTGLSALGYNSDGTNLQPSGNQTSKRRGPRGPQAGPSGVQKDKSKGEKNDRFPQQGNKTNRSKNKSPKFNTAGPSTSFQAQENCIPRNKGQSNKTTQNSEVKVKKNRRRERPKTPKKPPSEQPSNGPINHKISHTFIKPHSKKSPPKNQSQIIYNFNVKPFDNPVGYFFKERSPKHKYINLKSFISNRLSPVIFKTNDKIPSIKSRSLLRTENVTLTSSTCELRVNRSDEDVSVTSTFAELRISTPQKNPEEIAEKKPKRRLKKQQPQKTFPDYLSLDEVVEGLAKKTVIKGFVRINPKNSRDSYVSNEDTTLADYYITSVIDRNRALEGDEVVLRVKPESEWLDGKKTATVVYISKAVHPRVAVGTLKKLDKNPEFAEFRPRDKRIPPIRIPKICWPNGFKENPKQYQNILFVAKISEWNHPDYALGTITESLGVKGDLKVETVSILREFCLDTTPFSNDVAQYLPQSKEIPEEEFKYREDIRKQCVFTIDPLTARDLDDAVSVRKLPNGNYEVGVHISDASFYLEEGTELDQMVCNKATTIYLVDNVYHMLPVELCLHCSLLPGKDKLAISVFWEMNEQGEIFDTRFTRTIINSCTQLAYEHAQMMIENPHREFKESELPTIHNDFTAKDLSETVNILQKIAVNLRQKRVDCGALRIDQVKLLFSLNPVNGEPLDFRIYENKDAHRLIEEFMLLANISVAKKINETFPHLAFLRCHDPPKNTMLVELQNSLATCGIHIDISSSGGINASMRKYITDDFAGICRGAVLNHMLSKPMTRARYFCSSTVESEDEYKHYALSVPIYTHFTSPIRRYADIMVHRLLAASLGYSEEPAWDVDYVSAVAANCNAQKYNAKRAGEASSDLYLAHYVEQHQPYLQNCVVVDVRERSFDAIVLMTGSIVRVYPNTCEDSPRWTVEAIPNPRVDSDGSKVENDKKTLKLTLSYPKTKEFPETSVVIETFSLVKVRLTRKPNTYKLEATLLKPIMSTTFMKQ